MWSNHISNTLSQARAYVSYETNLLQMPLILSLWENHVNQLIVGTDKVNNDKWYL